MGHAGNIYTLEIGTSYESRLFLPREQVVTHCSVFLLKGLLGVEFCLLITVGNLEIAHPIWPPHWTDGKTEAQRRATWPRSHSGLMAEPR